MSTANLRVEVRTGVADRKQVDFTPGQVAEPFSVGLAGGWLIAAPGMAEVHAYLYFDGTTLFVARVGHASVTMAGSEIPEGWVPVEVPMNIHLGGAKLAVRGPTFKPAAGAVPRPPSVSSEFQAVPVSVRHGPAGTIVQDTPGGGAAVHSQFDVPVDSEKTVVQVRDDMEDSPPAVPRRDPLPASERTRLQPVAPMPMAPVAPAPGEATALKPLAQYGPASVTRDAPILHPPRSPSNEPTVSAAVRAPPANVPLMAPPGAPGAYGYAPAPPVPPTAGPPDAAPQKSQESGLAKALATVKKSWKEASIPQRIILVLLPFGFAAVVVMFKSPPPPEPVHGGVTASGGHETPSATGSSSAKPALSAPAPMPAPPQVQTATHAEAPKKAAEGHKKHEPKGKEEHGAKTTARLAVDALLEGDYAKALRDYQKLSADDPNNAAYKEAVHILKSKMKQQ